MPPSGLEISKLTPQKDGSYAILVNGQVLGRISANPQAAFVIGGEMGRPSAAVLGAGSHVYEFNGKKLKIEVKDLKLRFAPEYEGEEHMAPPAKMEDKLEFIAKNKKANEKAMEELLSRVVVTE